jgi:acyl-CoA synthetase (AMP-forming)/AMP-acid ligase II
MEEDQFADIQRAAPNAGIVAGYGSTEQNVTIIQKEPLTEDEKKQLAEKGINWRRVLGSPLPGLDWVLLDDEDPSKLAPEGKPGLFAVRGLGVMTPDEGYDGGGEKPTTWVERDGKTYHNSGDLLQRVTLRGPDGATKELLVFASRKERVSKIGGEMIGHEAIEGALKPILPPAEDGYSVIVVRGQKEDSPPIVYVTSETDAQGAPLTMKRVHAALMDAFNSNVNYSVAEVRVTDRIEALGSGKVNVGKYAELAQAPHPGKVLRFGG